MCRIYELIWIRGVCVWAVGEAWCDQKASNRPHFKSSLIPPVTVTTPTAAGPCHHTIHQPPGSQPGGLAIKVPLSGGLPAPRSRRGTFKDFNLVN